MATRIGVRDLHAFPLLQDNEAGVRYGEPFRVAKTISIGISPNQQEASLYADDALVEYYSATTAYDISIEVDDLTPEVRGKLLGQEPDVNGVVTLTSEVTAPELAVAFRALRSDGTYEYRVQYRVRFAPVEDNYEAQGESVSFQTQTLRGRSMALEHDGSYGAFVIGDSSNKTLTDEWFKKPAGTYRTTTPTASQ